jgi:hypothetical protein
MDVKFLTLLILENQMNSQVSFAGGIFTRMSLDLPQLA